MTRGFSISPDAIAIDESGLLLNGRSVSVGEVLLLLETLEMTSDGVPIALCSALFCPACGAEAERQNKVCWCWSCAKPFAIQLCTSARNPGLTQRIVQADAATIIDAAEDRPSL